MPLDLADIQGLVHREYGYPRSRHLLFEISNPVAGRKLLKFLVPQTTHAALPSDSRPESLLNVGISHNGLEALGVKTRFLKRFPQEFREEPDALTTGDLGDSDPAKWWNGKFRTEQVHVVVHLFGQSPEAIERATTGVRQAAAENRELLPTKSDGPIEGGSLGTEPGEVHFGYRDGLSQPRVRWDEDPLQPREVNYRHFILGYATSDIPSAPQAFASNPDSVKAAELGRNGTYSVFRWLYQDVALFNRFLLAEGPRAFPELPPEDAQELLAAKLMGRWRDGTPLVLSPTKPPDSALSTSNDFGYAEDLQGERCPVSAHIRVTNPRDQELDEASKVLGGVPRVIRRGTPYGPKLEGTVDDAVERGLAGMFLCASIRQQFYKLAVWMKENSFSPAFSNQHAQDPLANRKYPGASDQFVIPAAGGNRSVTLRDFVTTKGTAFFLIPGLHALQQLADGEYQ
jgi:deferrochelatase/peroxidase EfeB